MRLFFGVSLPPSVREAAARAARTLFAAVPGRYVLPENYHMTLAFLGDVPQERLEEAKQALADTLARFPAPTLTLAGADYFGERHKAILILRVRTEADLAGLHGALTGELRRRGLPVSDGPFSPHVTLARHADARDAELCAFPVEPCTFAAQEAHVYLSARDEAGVLRYTPLSCAPFAHYTASCADSEP